MLPSSFQKKGSAPPLSVLPVDTNNNDVNNARPFVLSKDPAESWISTTSLPLMVLPPGANKFHPSRSGNAETKNFNAHVVPGPSRVPEQMPELRFPSNSRTVQVDLRPKVKGARRVHSLQPFLVQMGVPQDEMKDVWDPAVALSRAKASKKTWEEYRLDDFEIGKPLGEGRYGHVYLARTVLAQRIVALKVLHMDEIEKDRLEHMVEREIDIHSRLRHPNIISMLGCFVDPEKGKLGMVLEYAPGGDLFTLFKAQPDQRLSHLKCASYIKQVIEALIHLHSQNILHRDIKPENILIGYHGELKLSDFGWAIKRKNPNVGRRTICGTWDYMAPEILMNQSYDDKADLWGLGTLSYELLTGEVPFPNTEPSRKGERSTNFKRPILQFPAFVHDSAQDFISNLLKQKPACRMNLTTARSHQWMQEAEVDTRNELLPMFKSFEQVDIEGMKEAYIQIVQKVSK